MNSRLESCIGREVRRISFETFPKELLKVDFSTFSRIKKSKLDNLGGLNSNKYLNRIYSPRIKKPSIGLIESLLG